ncbi:hypothetical protein sscle_16g109500 [Sclerotinia sclerotiorum 1980 UF-70]|uniref:Uncharacterized protein n=2 Tax=Sclerotinia sclerotiorum (strain ATCC 18683 / 1980 / Ss-1) TaxID=665079 RepID=A0A1D9QMM6_SCLS1|nr:hypothetical protein sscle_16g109500 [Sclerotinia sclerotiorum 1980 UF-70]
MKNHHRRRLFLAQTTLQSHQILNSQESTGRLLDILEPSIDLHEPKGYGIQACAGKRPFPDTLEPPFDLDGPARDFHFHKERKGQPLARSTAQSDESISDNGGSSRPLFNNNNDLPEKELVFLNTAFTVDESNLPANFAVLNKKTTRVLCQMKNIGCHFETNSSKLGHDSTEKRTYHYIDITVAGPKNIGDVIGTLLSAKKIYLQHPEMARLEKYVQYYNPHFLSFDNVPSCNVVDSRKLHAINFYSEYSLNTESDTRSDTQLKPKLYNRVAKIFDSLTRYRNLRRVEVVVKIMTPLMQHQAEALDFIAQREFGPIPDEYSLWTTQTYETQTCYQHKISRHKLGKIPVERGGGILADGVGLGKTLTVLASIMQTSKEAKDFLDCSLRNFGPSRKPQTQSYFQIDACYSTDTFLDDLGAFVSFIGSYPLDDPSVFRKHIINPLLKEEEEGANNLQTLLDSEETQAIKQQDSRSRNKNGYFGIFQLQLKLRRLCNHGTLFKKHSPISQNDTEFDPEQALGLLQEKNDSRCHYCDVEIVGLDPSVSCRGRFTTCGHLSTSEDTRILIMTTGTGRVCFLVSKGHALANIQSLNLTISNYVYILEPQWNPIVESQAIARVQRIGQNRNVKIFRYIVEDTVEKGIQNRQSRKLNFAKMGWTSDHSELQ